MKIAIIGGKLQGTEACYLAVKAGIETLLIDRNPKAPASGLCDEFLCCDLTARIPEMIHKLKQVDFILPAMENAEVLEAVEKISEELLIPLAFDPKAYGITSSKLRSDELMHVHKVPAPAYYPHCKGLCIAKPSAGSGSEGVQKMYAAEAERFLKEQEEPENWIIQEFLEGPSYSIEVIGSDHCYQTYTITQIHMDPLYDCKRVTAPCPLTSRQEEAFSQLGKALAEMVGLYGIMDVEVIDDHGDFKVLEIDARIPSQTPAAVYHASGINLLQEIAELIITGQVAEKQPAAEKYCSYEHFYISHGKVIETGEHIMSTAAPLVYREQFLGADEVISDYQQGRETWRGIFINSAATEELLEQKRERMIREIKNISGESAKAGEEIKWSSAQTKNG